MDAVGLWFDRYGHVLVAGGAFSPSISVSSCLLQCALGDGSGQEQERSADRPRVPNRQRDQGLP